MNQLLEVVTYLSLPPDDKHRDSNLSIPLINHFLPHPRTTWCDHSDIPTHTRLNNNDDDDDDANRTHKSDANWIDSRISIDTQIVSTSPIPYLTSTPPSHLHSPVVQLRLYKTWCTPDSWSRLRDIEPLLAVPELTMMLGLYNID